MTQSEKVKYSSYPRLIIDAINCSKAGWRNVSEEVERLGFTILYQENIMIADVVLLVVEKIPENFDESKYSKFIQVKK